MKQEIYESPEQGKAENQHGKFAGLFLILIGGIFFMGMSDIIILGMSPWALIALLPVYWIGITAYKKYQEDGRVSRRVFSILVWGLIPFVYMIGAFLGWDIGALWPIGMVAAGASMLLFGTQK